jgi:hypothetical protein
VVFERTIPVFGRGKTVHALDREATMIGELRVLPTSDQCRCNALDICCRGTQFDILNQVFRGILRYIQENVRTMLRNWPRLFPFKSTIIHPSLIICFCSLKCSIFYDVTPCSPIIVSRTSSGLLRTCCMLHVSCLVYSSTLRMEATCSS